MFTGPYSKREKKFSEAKWLKRKLTYLFRLIIVFFKFLILDFVLKIL